MASVTKANNGYRAQISVKGIRDSQVFRTKREADAWAASRETEIRAELTKPIGQRRTLRDALQKYAAEVSNKKRGERWEVIRLQLFERLPYLPSDKLIGDITAQDIALFRDGRLDEVSPGSFLREMNILSNVFGVAIREWGWIKENPTANIRKPKKPPHRDVTITRQQIKAMLLEMGYSPKKPVRTMSQSVAACFLLSLRSGMRAKELCNLEWNDIKDGYCVLHETKTIPRDVPLTPKAMQIIAKLQGFDSKTVFGLKPQTLSSFFLKYRKRAGLDGFTFHDARHTAATWIAARMKSNNVSAQQAVFDMCKAFGWKNVSQALVYYNPSASDIAKRMS